ncbi:hypothetical protein [Paenibacillus herberti]|uniref:Uncharacterized protein n=1 Tax=Paenibacillus herberti TaxID=1619309 RepID=A0A229P4B1_9BACL|nr:hypothetical protein [Paenibacillus herberti]OXM16794.1 hypothetical protein CGZ75_09100 [Paenibacillus herberti]
MNNNGYEQQRVNPNGKSIGIILILFILLVIVTQAFLTSTQSEEPDQLVILATQGFDVYNHTNYQFNFIESTMTKVTPTPLNIPSQGKTHIELPLKWQDTSTSVLFFSIKDNEVPPNPNFPTNAQMRFTISCEYDFFGGKKSYVFYYSSNAVPLRFTSTNTSLRIYYPE